MKASVISETGGPEVIRIEDVPKPEIEADDILVEVKASAVNHTDVWIRRGYKGDPPIITGIDVAGVIADTGAAVKQFNVGDRVVLYWNTTCCGDCEFCKDVLVLGASGGVGHGAVQIASHAGSTVYAASSSEEKAERLRGLGADHVIDYTKTDIDDAIADLTDRRAKSIFTLSERKWVRL